MNIIVFDTETAGVKTQSLLNIGYTIVNLDLTTFGFETCISRDYLMRDIYSNRLWMLNDMFVGEERLAAMESNVLHRGTKVRTEKQAFEQLSKDIDKYAVEFGYAYNCLFDTDKFSKTAIAYGIPNPLEKITVLDLWGFAYWNICVTADYQAFCTTHRLKTKSGQFFPTSVEGVTAYLLNDPTFKEEHTALSDVSHELRILCECGKRGQDIFKMVSRGGWIRLDGTIVEDAEAAPSAAEGQALPQS